MENKKADTFFDKLPPSLIKTTNVTLVPEGVLGYLVGPTLALLANSILTSFLNKYLTDVLHVNSWASAFFTWLPVASVALVVIGNILVGRLMDSMASAAGKSRPLILLSVPLSLLALLFLFVFPPYDAATTDWHVASLVSIAIGYNLWFAIAYPMYYASHAGLVNVSTRNSKDRGLLSTLSNAATLAAIGLASMVLPFFLSLLFVNDAQVSYDRWKVFVFALIAVTLAGVLIEYFFTRERITEESLEVGKPKEEKKAVSVAEQAKICLKDRYWIIMMACFFLYHFGGVVKNVSQNYFCTAMFADALGNYTVANGGTLQGTLSVIGAIPTALGMFVALPLANRIGKAKAIMAGAALAVVGGSIGMAFPDNFAIVAVSFAVKAFGSTPAKYLSLALLADVIEHQEATHGLRTDGLSMAVYGCFVAGMAGLATGVLNAALSAVSYDIATLQTNVALRQVLPWVFIGVETICYFLIFVIFIFMGVERFSKNDHEAIAFDKKVAAERAEAEPAAKLTPDELAKEREG